ncbi:MAG: hypothetical protein ABIO65_10840, partial [Nitrospiria bacterium]
IGLVIAISSSVVLSAMKRMHREPEAGFDLMTPLAQIAAPQTVSAWTQGVGIILFALVIALLTAAIAAVKTGAGKTDSNEKS